MIYFEAEYDEEPVYVISVAARMVNLHPQTLRTCLLYTSPSPRDP